MTRCSIFTPLHKTDHTRIKELYACLREQTHEDWEWVIVLNGEGLDADISWSWTDSHPDSRIKFVRASYTGNVGALKRLGCRESTGDILIEVDYDDLLTADCLEEIVKAFDADPNATLVYSDFAAVNNDWSSFPFASNMGWTTYPVDFKGKRILASVASEPNPSDVSTILFAPNHVRAWRTTHYWAMGGHNPDLKVGDDHELCCRSFLHGKLVRIPKCLYVYRVHDDNSWRKHQDAITAQSNANQARYLIPMYEKWADGLGLKKVDLAGGDERPNGYAFPSCSWPDSSVGVLRAVGIVERLPSMVDTMNDAWRVLAHGGLMILDFPSTDGRGAFMDPRNVTHLNANSLYWYTRKINAKDIPAFKGRFQVISVENVFPSPFDRANHILVTRARLIALKSDTPRFKGALEI